MIKVFCFLAFVLFWEITYSQSLTQEVVYIMIKEKKKFLGGSIKGINSELNANVSSHLVDSFGDDSLIISNYNYDSNNFVYKKDSAVKIEELIIPKKYRCNKRKQSWHISQSFKIGKLNCVYAKLIYKDDSGGTGVIFIFSDMNIFLGHRTSLFIY